MSIRIARRLAGALLGTSALLLTTCAAAQDSSPENHPPLPERANIVETAAAAGSFDILAAALEATDLTAVLADENREFTVFAPTDEAFSALGKSTLDALLADPETLSNILLYHVIADQTVDAATAVSLSGSSVTAANGDELTLQAKGEDLFINASRVISADVRASNGIIHVIDRVLTPPSEFPEPASNIVETAAAAGSFDTLLSLLVTTGLDAVLADASAEFTVFAPTDEAFSRLDAATLDALQADPELLESVLLYHVLAGQQVDEATAIGLAGSGVETANGESVRISLDDKHLLINESKVVTADVRASNGIIHAIDAVLIPPSLSNPAGPTLADVVAGGEDFRILEYALEVTGLTEVLDDAAATFTVFAPTDHAFARLGYRNLVWLFRHPDALRSVLLYHVVPDTRVDAATAFTLDSAAVTTANGQDIDIRVRNDKLFINRSRVIATDIEASNGIAHAINRVLIPRLH